MACRAPTARAASAAPSSTRWGTSRNSARSFLLAGSPSVALTTSTLGPAGGATEVQLDRGREGGAAVAEQARACNGGDDLLGLQADVAERSVDRGVLVESVHRALADAAQHAGSW